MTKISAFIFLCIAFIASTCASGVRTPKYKIALVADMRGQHGVFVISSDQTGGRLLTPDETAQLRASSWSPDGKKIAFFALRNEDLPMRQKYRIPLHYPLYWMDATGGNQERLVDVPVSSFAWSPDSRSLLFVSAYEDPAHDDPEVIKGLKIPMSAVYLLDLRTRSKRRVTDFGKNCYASWSPDGTRLAISFGDSQKSDIYVATLDGKQTRRITDSEGIKVRPVWSPDGKRIAYVSFILQATGFLQNAYVIESDGTNNRKVGDGNPYEVSWSVDGKSLLLQSVDGITVASLDGNTLLDFRNRAIKTVDAVFTPDGKEIMFRSNHEGPWYLYAADLKETNVRRISGRLSASTFCLSPIRD